MPTLITQTQNIGHTHTCSNVKYTPRKTCHDYVTHTTYICIHLCLNDTRLRPSCTKSPLSCFGTQEQKLFLKLIYFSLQESRLFRIKSTVQYINNILYNAYENIFIQININQSERIKYKKCCIVYCQNHYN